nr:hypothetical protein [Dyadobacter sp. CY323]
MTAASSLDQNEAKALGITMGAPALLFEKKFKEQQIHVFSSNCVLYRDMSNRVMTLLGRYIPAMEIYSIDEAFWDRTKCFLLVRI